MKTNLHESYDQLTPQEKITLDECIERIFEEFRFHNGMKLKNDDRAEIFADAFAKWIIESRQ